MVLEHEFVSKLGLGTVQFGMPYGISNSTGQTAVAEVSSILQLAKSIGVNLIDTAISYGNAEEVLGENDLTFFNVVSKFNLLKEGESPIHQLEYSLHSLKIQRLYGFLAHRPKQIIDSPKFWEELLKAKSEGRIQKLGFSLNTPEEFDSLGLNGLKADLIQVPYNFLDRRFEPIMKKCKEDKCEVHTRSTFLQGLFFMTTDSLPPFFDEVKPVINMLQETYKEGLSGALLKFALANQSVDKVIIGVNNSLQLQMNIEQLDSCEIFEDLNFKISENILTPFKWPKF